MRRLCARTVALSAAVGLTAATQMSPALAATTKTFTGPTVQERYGAVRVEIFVSKKKRIVKVKALTAADSARSEQENTDAIPVLRSETLKSQSANINAVSGATQTSEAYISSLASAISKAKKEKALH